MNSTQRQLVGILIVLLVAGLLFPVVAAGGQQASVDQDAATNTEQEAAAEARGGNASANQEAYVNTEQNANVQVGEQQQQDQQPLQEQEQAQEVTDASERELLVQIVALLQAVLEELRELTAEDVQQTGSDTVTEREQAQERQTKQQDRDVTVHQETRTEVKQNTEIVTIGPFQVNDPAKTDSVREIVVLKKTTNATEQEGAQESVQQRNRTDSDGQAVINQSATSAIRQDAEATVGGNDSAAVDQDARSGIAQEANASA